VYNWICGSDPANPAQIYGQSWFKSNPLHIEILMVDIVIIK
jgi:hypothetical protein